MIPDAGHHLLSNACDDLPHHRRQRQARKAESATPIILHVHVHTLGADTSSTCFCSLQNNA